MTSWETFALDFEPSLGDAIRLKGSAGGRGDFVAIAELEVWAEGEPAVREVAGQLLARPSRR